MKRLFVLTILLGVFVLSPSSATLLAQDSSEPSDPLSAFLSMYEAINAGDLDASLEIIGENTVGIALPPPPDANAYFIGPEAYAGLNSYLIGSNANFEFVDTQVTGNTITFRALLTEDLFRFAGYFPVEFTGSAVVQDGMLVSETWIMNQRDSDAVDAALAKEVNKDAVRRFYDEIWSEGNVDTIDEIIHPDFIDNFSGENGREPFKELVLFFRSAFPDYEATYKNVVADGDLVVAEVTFTGTYQGGFGEVFGVPDSAIGSEIILHGIDYARFENGMMIEGWGVHDDLNWLQQFGLELGLASG